LILGYLPSALDTRNQSGLSLGDPNQEPYNFNIIN